jgi:hypothetical protein
MMRVRRLAAAYEAGLLGDIPKVPSLDKRPRGRPSKRPQDRLFQMRVSEQFLRTVDEWRSYQTDLPSRAEAVRRLVELAAKIKKKPDGDR